MDVFHIEKLIPPGIDEAIKFMPNDDKFNFMTCDGDNLEPKVVIKDMNFMVATKQMFDATELAHRALIRDHNMRLPYSNVMMKHVAISCSTICLDNIFTIKLPDLVRMGFVTNTTFAGSYTVNCYNFKNFKIKQMDLVWNGMQVPRFG